MISEMLVPGSASVWKGPLHLGESSGEAWSREGPGGTAAPALAGKAAAHGPRSGGSGWELGSVCLSSLTAIGRRREGRGGKTGMPGDRDGVGVRGDRTERVLVRGA